MRCNRCGADFVGNFCPNCGAPVNQPIQTTGKAKPPARKKGLKTWQIVLITLGCVLGAPIVLLTIVSLVIGIQTAVDVFGESSSLTSYYSALASSDTDTPSYTESVESDDDTSESSETSSRYTNGPTKGQMNALREAESYLRVMAFSRSGLIEQLEYEGYSTEEATYAVDQCGADWMEQAVKKAESYLNTMAFSKSGLIEQLEYEGFTHEEAVYGVEQNGY